MEIAGYREVGEAGADHRTRQGEKAAEVRLSVIYGRSSASPRTWLTDESGAAGSGVVLVTTDGMTSGMSIELASDGSWQAQAAPSPGVGPVPEPGTGSLVLAGLAILAGCRRRIASSL